mmetsp:Transcript_66798/g.184585  ORF Transcript_66798/g.184585 Transcript_66798/m.184585 type:complete len:203 (-) Transcript_66798:321-929(-)
MSATLSEAYDAPRWAMLCMPQGARAGASSSTQPVEPPNRGRRPTAPHRTRALPKVRDCHGAHPSCACLTASRRRAMATSRLRRGASRDRSAFGAGSSPARATPLALRGIPRTCRAVSVLCSRSYHTTPCLTSSPLARYRTRRLMTRTAAQCRYVCCRDSMARGNRNGPPGGTIESESSLACGKATRLVPSCLVTATGSSETI